MRKLCPNFDRDDGLDTVLEVPIPEEMFSSTNKNTYPKFGWSWLMFKSSPDKPQPDSPTILSGSDHNSDIQLLLGVVGAPLIPSPLPSDHHSSGDIKDHPIDSSMAKYIVQQYVAAMGGEAALDAVESMYAVGKVRMAASEFVGGGDRKFTPTKTKNGGVCPRKRGGCVGEIGSFVLWQKRPELWSLEMVVSGSKISAGSDGHVAWRQTPWQHTHASRGPPRPLRRSVQGLDPRSTAKLFSNSICVDEKAIDDEDCFILKVEAEPSTLKARSSCNVEIIRHTIWGYFSQKTGLLVHLQDSHLLRIRTRPNTSVNPNDDAVFWETNMDSAISDYRSVDGVSIAHSGRTVVSLFRHGGEGSDTRRRPATRMEEAWTIEEVGFNIKGLSRDCFLPPADLRREETVEGCGGIIVSAARLQPKIRAATAAATRFGASRVAAVDDVDSDGFEEPEEL